MDHAVPAENINAVSVALWREGRFLLVRRGRAPALGLYAFPGGRVEPRESAEQAARREITEETGLQLGAITHFRTIVLAAEPGSGAFRLAVFVSRDAIGEPIAGDDAESVGWFTPAEMEALPITPSTFEIACEIAAGHLADMPNRSV